jgi:RNA polymerase sigma-54 factor
VQPVVPDVVVRAASDGSWIVELNSDTLPRVLVNRSYYTRVSKTTRTEKDKGFLLDCLQNANWLVKSLDQRVRTILKVAEEIVRQQDGFLTHGVQYLRPLNLKTVADAIKMHESTVSRVTSNKYMATSRGIFELKYFFTSAIAAAGDGAAHSSEAVRHRIKTLIDAESPGAILSDDKIVEILQKDGIERRCAFHPLCGVAARSVFQSTMAERCEATSICNCLRKLHDSGALTCRSCSIDRCWCHD